MTHPSQRPSAPSPPESPQTAIERIIAQQLEVMRRQLVMLNAAGAPAPEDARVPAPATASAAPTEASRAHSRPAPRHEAPAASSHPAPSPRSYPLTLPVTDAQTEIWLATRYGDTASCAYNESTAFKLNGSLDVEALRAAVRSTVQRHESLRATFDAAGETLTIHPAIELDVPLVDLSGRPPADAERELTQLSAADVCTPFDLERGPLLRVRVVRRAEDRHVLVVTAHHLICDGWSFDVMMRDLSEAYSLAREGRPDTRPLPTMQFSDYAQWLRQAKGTAEMQSAEAYWIGRLAGELSVLELPADRPRPPIRSWRGARIDRELDPDLYARIKKVGARSGATLYGTLLSAYAALLHRLTGQREMIIAMLAAGQAAVGSHDLVGHCTHLLPLRITVDPEEPFRTLLARVMSLVLDAYDHQAVTFGTLVKHLKVKRDASRTPLVSALFNVDPALHGLRFSGLELDYGNNPRCAYQFDLGFNLTAFDARLITACDFSTDLFEPETIERWLRHYARLIEDATADPERPVGRLAVLDADERTGILEGWNATERVVPPGGVQRLFEEWVDRTPDAVAVVNGARSITYGGLERDANRLAEHLLAIGLQPGDRVGVFMDRSIEAATALLGTLKAGGAYVPLDPAFPADRIAFMLADSGARFVLTDSRQHSDLPATNARVVQLDADGAAIAQRSARRPAGGPPERLAYVIYTSGSTGTPKGVQIPHRAVVNFLRSMAREPGLGAEDVLLSVTTMSFDIFGLELYLPLATGARVVLADREDTLDGQRLGELIDEHRVSVLQATPSTWRLLIDSGWRGRKSLRMLCGGEALPRDLVAPLLELGGELWNLYGPTETTIWSTVHRIRSADEPILIGRPIDNTRTHVLDGSLQPVPIGVTGELFIGGLGLALGYLNRPELTAEKFIPDPFRQGERLYRTGDLARYRPNGAIECLGRVDHQVKLRGFRIELGEIETRLKDLTAVRECAAVLREDRPGDRRLVAYLVLREGAATSDTELRLHLRGHLPEYMVPQHFVRLPELPLTPNRKIDRKALPAPQSEGPIERVLVPPRSEVEQAIAVLWQDVLRSGPFGVQDDFFESGGHSLLATQVMSRLNRLFGIKLPLHKLFEATTIESQAALVDALRWVADTPPPPPPSGTAVVREVIEI